MEVKLFCATKIPNAVTTEYERAQSSEKMLTISTSTWHVIWRKKVTENGKRAFNMVDKSISLRFSVCL